MDWHSAKARAHGKVQFSGSKPHPLIGKLIDRVHEIYTEFLFTFSYHLKNNIILYMKFALLAHSNLILELV